MLTYRELYELLKKANDEQLAKTVYVSIKIGDDTLHSPVVEFTAQAELEVHPPITSAKFEYE